MTADWHFTPDEATIDEGGCLWNQEPGAPTEEGYYTNIVYEGEMFEVMWFPERMGVQTAIIGESEMPEQKGQEASVLGTILIKLLISGERCVKEL